MPTPRIVNTHDQLVAAGGGVAIVVSTGGARETYVDGWLMNDRDIDQQARDFAESLYELPFSQQIAAVARLVDAILARLRWHAEGVEKEKSP